MILAGFLIGCLTLLLGGLGITLWLKRGEARLNVIECCCLGWIFGSGAVSLLLWIGGRFASGNVLTSLVLMGCLGLGWAGWKTTARTGVKLCLPRPGNWLEWTLLSILAVQIAIVFVIALKHTLGWDGLLMWEAKARFAFLSNNVLPDFYYTSGRSLTHPEYPLGIPLTELWLYIWMGAPHQLWLKLLFPIFYVAGVALLAIVCARLTGRRWLGYGAAVLFFFVPHEVVGGGSATIGYVDFPLSIVYLATIGYLLLWLRSHATCDFRIFLASLVLLPWLKREGAILWLIAAGAGAIVVLVRRQPRLLVPVLVPGATLIAGWNLYLWMVWVEASQEFLPPSVAGLWQNAGRLLPTWRLLLRDISNVEAWGIFWLLAAVAIGYLLVRVRRLESGLLLWAILLPILAYSSIYVFSTSVDYLVHIKLSLARLLMQVVPVLWIAIASAVAAPWQGEKSA